VFIGEQWSQRLVTSMVIRYQGFLKEAREEDPTPLCEGSLRSECLRECAADRAWRHYVSSSWGRRVVVGASRPKLVRTRSVAVRPPL